MRISLGLIAATTLVGLLAAVSACSPTATQTPSTTPSTSPSPTPSPSNGSTFSAAQLASGGPSSNGIYVSPCVSIGASNTYGTNLNSGSGTSYSILKYISFSANSYSFVLTFQTSSNCSGTAIFSYLQSGTYTVGSATNTPANGYQVLYTATSSQLEVFGASFSGAWATTFNGSNCASGFGGAFSTSGTTTLNASGLTCNTNGISLSFPATGSYYDAIIPSSLTSPTSFFGYSNANVLMLGQFSSYPSTATLLY